MYCSIELLFEESDDRVDDFSDFQVDLRCLLLDRMTASLNKRCRLETIEVRHIYLTH